MGGCGIEIFVAIDRVIDHQMTGEDLAEDIENLNVLRSLVKKK